MSLENLSAGLGWVGLAGVAFHRTAGLVQSQRFGNPRWVIAGHRLLPAMGALGMVGALGSSYSSLERLLKGESGNKSSDLANVASGALSAPQIFQVIAAARGRANLGSLGRFSAFAAVASSLIGAVHLGYRSHLDAQSGNASSLEAFLGGILSIAPILGGMTAAMGGSFFQPWAGTAALVGAVGAGLGLLGIAFFKKESDGSAPSVQNILMQFGLSTLFLIDRRSLSLLLGPKRTNQLLVHEMKAVISERPTTYALRTIPVTRETAQVADRMAVILEKLTRDPKFEQLMLEGAPPVAHLNHGVRSMGLTVDFGISRDGRPLVMELNCNASRWQGGVALQRWMEATPKPPYFREPFMRDPVFRNPEMLEEVFVDCLREEWRLFQLNRGLTPRPLRSVLVTEVEPHLRAWFHEQKEIAACLQRRGIEARLASIYEVENLDGVDLVYNRDTDFFLESGKLVLLREALQSGRVCFTPHPRGYAMVLNKKSLITLYDLGQGRHPEIGLDADDRAFLGRVVPMTRYMTDADRSLSQADRANLIFKPIGLFGGRGIHRGDAISDVDLAALKPGEYLVQEIIDRQLYDGGVYADMRFFCYGGRVVYGNARTYRTPVANVHSYGDWGVGMAPYEWAPTGDVRKPNLT